MGVGYVVGCYVELAEGGDGHSGMCDVLYVSMRGRGGDHVEKLLGFVATICGQEHICGEDHTITTANLHRLHKDGDGS